MNPRKVAFIVCVNNELQFEECFYYINRLRVPDGYAIDVIAIREADSMCAGYNAAMQSSSAKYKVYLHQDVYIRNIDFLQEMISVFEKDDSVGMIGMTGGTDIPDTGIVFDTWNVGKVDVREPDMAYYMHTDESIKENKVVAAIDGMLMATQYDLPWREDLFTHFDFYDISQACEFRRAGYKVVVPYQQAPWIVHDCGFAKLGNYGIEREIFLQEYAEFISCKGSHDLENDNEWDSLSVQLEHQIAMMIEQGAWKAAWNALTIYHQANFRSSGLEIINVMVEIYRAEENSGVRAKFFDGFMNYMEMKEKYLLLRSALRRFELIPDHAESEEFLSLLADDVISYEAVITVMMHGIIDKKHVLEQLKMLYQAWGNTEAVKRVESLLLRVKKMPIPIAYSKGIKK